MEGLDTGDRGSPDRGVARAHQHEDGRSGESCRETGDRRKGARGTQVHGLQGLPVTRLGSSRDNAETTQSPTGGSSANHISIDLGGLTLLVVVMLACLIGACGVVMGIDISDRHAHDREFDRRMQQAQREEDTRASDLSAKFLDLQRQYRMTELKLDDWTVVAHRSGLVLPGDYTRGPQGNLDSQSFKQPKRK